MSGSENKNTTNELVKKYSVKSEAEMIAEQKQLEEEMVSRSKEYEQNITEFSTKIDEMKDDKGNVLALVKRPTAKQARRITPPQLAKYRNNLEELPYEIADQYTNDMYALMAELIVVPKHTAEEWMETTGDEFMAAFQAHIVKIREELGKNVERFLRRTTDTQS